MFCGTSTCQPRPDCIYTGPVPTPSVTAQQGEKCKQRTPPGAHGAIPAEQPDPHGAHAAPHSLGTQFSNLSLKGPLSSGLSPRTRHLCVSSVHPTLHTHRAISYQPQKSMGPTAAPQPSGMARNTGHGAAGTDRAGRDAGSHPRRGGGHGCPALRHQKQKSFGLQFP